MFRRFMIVCWVLFAIPAIVSLVSWPMYYKYGNDLDGLFVELKPLDNNSVEPEENIFDQFDEPNGKSASPDVTFGQYNRALRFDEIDRHRALERKQESWGMAAFAGMGIAAAILLWNILCHTAHWIWMGRRVGKG